MLKFKLWTRCCGVFLLWALSAITLPAQTFKTLYSFCAQSGCPDGYRANAGLVQGTDGNFYGTTAGGGASGYGTAFKITPGGKVTTLHSFNQTDGSNPFAALIQATDGNFYGTTTGGGAYFSGTVFKITPRGTLTTLHSFCAKQKNGSCTDGAQPYGGLVQGSDGNFYGTTSSYGGNQGGTVFKITPHGKLTTLHSFNGTDGESSVGTLIQATDGHLYGTTQAGGNNANACFLGCGTIFGITPSGTLTTLYDFCPQTNCSGGAQPYAGLAPGTDGNFYGTTYYGGANGGGVVFKITPGGTFTPLYSFCSQSKCQDGLNPEGVLVQGTDGNFYGTTQVGGTKRGSICNGCGTIFKITLSGTLTSLYDFCSRRGCADGALPAAGLIQGTDGNFYGTTSNGGGSSGGGTVFKLSVGLGPFVETQPTSGTVGTAVKILGTNLTGATSVTFNGTPATFTVKSKSEITTTVPTGATTGTVQVVTPGGPLSSNVPFTVK